MAISLLYPGPRVASKDIWKCEVSVNINVCFMFHFHINRVRFLIGLHVARPIQFGRKGICIRKTFRHTVSHFSCIHVEKNTMIWILKQSIYLQFQKIYRHRNRQKGYCWSVIIQELEARKAYEGQGSQHQHGQRGQPCVCQFPGEGTQLGASKNPQCRKFSTQSKNRMTVSRNPALLTCTQTQI